MSLSLSPPPSSPPSLPPVNELCLPIWQAPLCLVSTYPPPHPNMHTSGFLPSVPISHKSSSFPPIPPPQWARAPSGSATRQRVVPTDRHSFVVCQWVAHVKAGGALRARESRQRGRHWLNHLPCVAETSLSPQEGGQRRHVSTVRKGGGVICDL